jgi:proline iminopeptidase
MTPDKDTNQEFQLNVGDGHELYVQDWGNEDSDKTIIFLHGGPGDGVNDGYRHMFDPKLQRVIFFDQRGCGKSTPYGSIEHNTTDDLVGDITKIADKLKLDQFILTGGSWGSCLALVYALRNPERVSAIVLRGIFTARQSETDWVEKGHFKTFFPDVWETYLAGTPKEQRGNPNAYHVSKILGNDNRFRPSPIEEFDPAGAKIETHYISQGCFLPDSYIIDNAKSLTMPIWLVQGRYDMVCPPVTAFELNQQLPNSQLLWTTAGHGSDRANYDVYRTILLQMVS